MNSVLCLSIIFHRSVDLSFFFSIFYFYLSNCFFFFPVFLFRWFLFPFSVCLIFFDLSVFLLFPFVYFPLRSSVFFPVCLFVYLSPDLYFYPSAIPGFPSAESPVVNISSCFARNASNEKTGWELGFCHVARACVRTPIRLVDPEGRRIRDIDGVHRDSHGAMLAVAAMEW